MDIQGRIDLDHVERAEQSAVVDHLHAQLRLAPGRTAEYRRADTGRDVGIDEIEIETDVEVAAGAGDVFQHLRHDGAHADFIDPAHVVDDEAAVDDAFFLHRIDGTDPDLEDPFGIDHRCCMTEIEQIAMAVAAQDGDRHPVHVARGARLLRVEVGVRIEPEHRQGRPLAGAVPGDRGDRADGERVIAAHQDRRLVAVEGRRDGVAHRTAPGERLVEMAPAVDRRTQRIGRSREIAVIVHPVAHAGQGRLQARHAQCLRSQIGAARARGDVARGADQTERPRRAGGGGRGVAMCGCRGHARLLRRRSDRAFGRAGRDRSLQPEHGTEAHE